MPVDDVPGEPELLVVGRITRPHGVRGAVIVEVISDWPGRFRPDARVLLETAPSRFEEVIIQSCSPHKGGLLVSLSGIGDRDSAEGLRGCLLFIPGNEAVPLGEEEYWVHEIIGMSVVTEDGVTLGIVSEYISGSGQDLLLVEDKNGGQFEIPFVGEFIKRIDRETSEITVRVIEGLVP
jgi:16S rRNA processing protein RimM